MDDQARRRQRLGSGVALEMELAAGSGDVAHWMKARLLNRAQDLLWDAWDNPDRKRRIRMAHRALELSEYAADAYVILAQDEAESLEEETELYRKGVDAGRRALELSETPLDDLVFWHDIQTRPFMRALDGLADCSWRAGRLVEAATHYALLLKLNASDDAGVRYLLSQVLLEAGLDDEAGALFEAYGEQHRLEWAYGKALLAFRKHGDTEDSVRELHMGFMLNRYVARYLTGKKALPTAPPEQFLEESIQEAASYACGGIKAWRETPCAVEWLAEKDDAPKPWQTWKKRKQ